MAEPKVALVTGSTSGIGLACAHALAGKGCDVIITGFGPDDVIEGIKDDIRSRHGVRVHYVSCDLQSVPQIQTLCDFVHDLCPGGLDILVNNAGFNHVAPIEEYPDKEWDAMIAVMLSAPFHLTKRFLPKMKQKGWGRIVNMSSQLGIVSAVNKSVYSAAKAGLIGLTKGVALEVAQHSITCNAICPTFAATDIMLKQIEEISKSRGVTLEEAEQKFSGAIPTKKMVQPSQIAELVQFLCLSDAAGSMTGATYLIDGGYTAQ